MDFEKKSIDYINEDGVYKVDELNRAQLGSEHFKDGQEIFVSKEIENGGEEINDLSSKFEKKSFEKKKDKKDKSSHSGVNQAAHASSGFMSALPTVVISLTAAVAVIGTATGLIKVKPSNDVSIFLSRSTELGFRINKEVEKTYMMYLSNAEYNYSRQVTLNNEFIFDDLIPNTVYELTAYDTSVEPMKRVFSSSYMTKAFDTYSSFISSEGVVDDILTFYVEYEGNNISFVTIEVTGDNNKSLYLYEGAPINEFSVNVAGNNNISCKVSINGELTRFAQLVSEEKPIAVTSVSLDKHNLDLLVGEKSQFNASVLPENASNQNVYYVSSDESVASVTQNGIVTAIKEGTSIITVISEDGALKDECLLIVTKDHPAVHVTSISLDKENLQMTSGESFTLSATILPNNASEQTIYWSSDNEDVATVNNGVVTAVGEGSANIEVVTLDGEFTATCSIIVSDEVIPVTGVSLEPDNVELSVGETYALTAKVLPLDATNKEVIFASSDESVATIDENGVVTAISVGTVVITVKTAEGEYQDYCIITVK